MPSAEAHPSPLPLDAASAAPVAAARGLLTRSFAALLVTQFMVSLNDNMFRWLIVPIGKDVMEDADLARALGLAAITLPFLLFAALAGYLADRFSKRSVMIACKVAEIFTMVLGVAAILVGSVHGMFAVLFLMGAQAAIFSPAKYGSIPEIVRENRLSAANGVIGLTTMMAIIAGVWAGGVLYTATTRPGEGPSGTYRWWMSAAAVLGVALIGWFASLFIGRLRPANPTRHFPFELFGQTVRDLRTLASHRGLFLVALGSSFFWGLGALAQMNVDKFAQEVLYVPQEQVGPLLAALVLGIGIGNLLAGILSAGKIELGIVPLGAAGIVLTSMLLATVPGSSPEDPNGLAYGWACFWLFALGIGAGLYDVPFQAYLQHHSPVQTRGSILAAYNFLAFSAMLLAAPVFWFLGGACGLSARAISVVAGLGTLPVLACIVLLIPRDTLRFILRTTMRLLYRVRIEGLENLPAQGGYLVAPNHVTWIDGFLIALCLPARVRFIVFADYFRGGFARWFGRIAEVIPIEPGKRSMIESLRNAREALENGDVIGIFPEGEIARSGQMQEFKPGFLKVLKGTGAPVVPVYLGGLWGSIFSNSGGRFFWKLPRRWPYPILIRIGQPIYNPTGVEEVRQAVVSLGAQQSG
jgi:acyl-[acyl-carrier-protein]-phospholipid O-acyltransferase / long-chain-fatty-acid--[acyl-carrier-protein] ligase